VYKNKLLLGLQNMRTWGLTWNSVGIVKRSTAFRRILPPELVCCFWTLWSGRWHPN
jgi:hypothetical protein